MATIKEWQDKIEVLLREMEDDLGSKVEDVHAQKRHASDVYGNIVLPDVTRGFSISVTFLK